MNIKRVSQQFTHEVKVKHEGFTVQGSVKHEGLSEIVDLVPFV